MTRAAADNGGSGVLRVVVSTVPLSAGVTLPAAVLGSRPVVLEASYSKDGVTTAMLSEAARHGCTTLEGWQMLLEQGLAQFERWTGREPPAETMAAAIAVR